MRFETSRPASMEIYKKPNESSDWQPYQYYTYDCEKDYGLKANMRISQSNYQAQHNFQYPGIQAESCLFELEKGGSSTPM